MNLSVHPHHRRHLRPAVRRVLTVTVVACIAVGGASFVLHSRSAVPAASATSTSSASAASEAESSLLTARQAQAILDDPRMVLVNHTNKMPDDHTFTTKACGSATAVNKTLQTEAADAFFRHAGRRRKGRRDHLDAERLPQRGLPEEPLRPKRPSISAIRA